ncbi:MAG TPA: arginine--tRNA ligase, partial [Flavobacterium sp.]|nr:arginine--tRNA ligase [Flavobacterium sp.]
MIAQLHQEIQSFITSEFGVSIQSLEFQATRKDFEGDVTLVVFPLVKLIKGNPTDIARQIGQHVSNNTDVVDRFNVVGGFLNLVISDAWYLEQFNQALTQDNYGFKALADEKAVMVEYASPNTNKPLHLGHIRNILLGYSVAKILEAAGHKVYQTQIVNDRGIHICKSMWAWKQAGADMTPENSGMKGDKLVGHFYVEFDKIYKEQINRLMA